MRKLRDRRGITLTEMLCTVLIVLLLTALLVVGIRFAGKTYTESMRLSEAQELCSTLTSVISDKLRFCGTVTQDENGGLTQIFIQNVGSVEGKGDAFQIGEDGQLALGDRHLLGSASYPKGLQVTVLYPALRCLHRHFLRHSGDRGPLPANPVPDLLRGQAHQSHRDLMRPRPASGKRPNAEITNEPPRP